MNELMNELRRPFHPSYITWKPGAVTKNGDKALGLAYADLRAYMNRLDEILGFDWSVSYTPWGDKVICNLTINGVTRSSTGEPDSQSERSEIAGTATEAQAFKRACAMFGLGRYLYEFPSPWAEYDKDRKQFTDKGRSLLEKIVVDHYNRQPTSTPSEVNFGMGAGVADPFVWPTEPDRLGMVAAMSEGDWLPGEGKRLAQYIAKLHRDSTYKLSTASTDGGRGQYGYLAGLLDKRYGKGSHRVILSLLCDAVVTHDDPPGGGVRELIDWLKEPASHVKKIGVLDELVNAFKQEMGQ